MVSDWIPCYVACHVYRGDLSKFIKHSNKYLRGSEMKNVKVWECKIIVDADFELPNGFDFPPRRAAIEAVEAAGIPVLGCSSGWGGNLTKGEREAFEAQSVQAYPDVYFAGVMDAPEDIAH